MRMRSASFLSNKCTAEAPSSPAKKPTTTTRVPKFLRCLYDILHCEDQTILTWSKDGSHFQIFDTKRLEAEILPKYFKHGKFASFQRQLNNFGFRKWTKTQSNVCTFSHHHYVRRHPHQLVELVILQNESVKSTTELSSPNSDTSPSVSHHSSKRKRTEGSCEPTKPATKVIKREPASCSGSRPSGLPLIKVDPSTFDFEVESWSLMADIRPLEWATKSTKSRLCALKAESGNETPTSAAGFADVTFDFTLEELDDILLTSSIPDSEEDQQVDVRLLNECYGVEPPLAWADGPELFGKAELEMYMQDTELWAGH